MKIVSGVALNGVSCAREHPASNPSPWSIMDEAEPISWRPLQFKPNVRCRLLAHSGQSDHRPSLSAIGGWSQRIDATLYL